MRLFLEEADGGDDVSSLRPSERRLPSGTVMSDISPPRQIMLNTHVVTMDIVQICDVYFGHQRVMVLGADLLNMARSSQVA